MAVLNLQLTSLQENLNVSPTPARAPDSDATTTPIDSSVAQNASVPLDTVTLASQADSGQGAGHNTDRNQQGQQLQLNESFFLSSFVANVGVDQLANANSAGTVSQTSQQTNAPS